MIWMYVGFLLFILLMLFLDLKVVNRHAHVIRPRESLIFTGVTVLLALSFAVAVYFMYENNWPTGITDTVVRQAVEAVKTEAPGTSKAADIAAAASPTGHGFDATVVYLTAWVLEYSLSVDNIFVIAVIFSYFRVPPQYQHRVLFWGILGALIMRGAMIAAGAELVERFQWIDYVFGAFLLYTAFKMARSGEGEEDIAHSPAVRIAARLMPVTPKYHEQRFFVRITPADVDLPACPSCGYDLTGTANPLCPECGRPNPFADAQRPATDREQGEPAAPPAATRGMLRAAKVGQLAVTPLFLALLVVEFTDVLFAVDSIPAVFSITKDPFLVFTSNVFAILGLRSLFFAVAAALGSFRYLKVSLVFVLGFIGVKMLLHHFVKIEAHWSLVVILSILLAGVSASLFASAHERRVKRTPIHDLAEAFDVTRRNLKKIFIFIIGGTVVLLGLAIGWLPGPAGIPMVMAGLAILATEFLWAQWLLKRLRRQAAELTQRADLVAQRTSPWLILPVVMLVAAGVIALAHHGPFDPVTVYLSSLAVWFPVLYWAYRTIRLHRRAVVEQRRLETGRVPAPPASAP